MPDDDVPVVVGRIAVKLPDFWRSNVSAWFKQVDAQFRISNTTSEQLKFDYVIQKLDHNTIDRVQDLIEDPPETSQFTLLKARLLTCFKKSNYQKLLEFRDLPSLGDRRPSELMDQLLSTIAGIGHTTDSCPFVEFAFLSRLPEHIRIVVSQVKWDDLRTLADKSDEIWATSPSNVVNALPVENLVISDEPAIAAVQRPRDTQRSQRQFDGRQQSRQPQWSRQQDGRQQFDGRQQPQFRRNLCAYHREFGVRARQCRQPCDWVPGNARTGGSRN